MLTAMGNVTPSHLMDRKLYPFTTLTSRMAQPDDSRGQGL